MKSMPPLIARLVAFGAAMALLLIMILQAINRPVDGDTATYTAEFTDANGLFVNNEVKLHGVAVGKVGGVKLEGDRARVTFTVREKYALYTGTTFAIRYESLTGQRYLDVRQSAEPSAKLAPGTRIGTDRTVPSFDITALFNGLQPVLAQLTPEDLNQFATSLLAVIDGTSTSLGPALAAIERLSGYATDRQAVISTLVSNLGTVAQDLGGKSGHSIASMSQLTLLFETLTQRITGLIDFANIIPPVLEPAEHMVGVLGLTPNTNPDLDNILRTLFPNPKDTVDMLNRVPGLLQSLGATIPRTAPGVNITCTKGVAATPELLQVFVGGQRITLCNP
ncbi:MlaD family protein [Nocardia sp. XZ_19_385]|uniref:MlaD family protein n=1 Tax=Nocardia sp. XZ_19_385 TaxID=2769488 RepID=UPI00188EC71B|nr:MCE family protein [Nocardia sp. XZ_19_385]